MNEDKPNDGGEMNITEFLEARIAEDEIAAYDIMGEREGDRVLAECAAKRAIIELHGALEDKGWQSGKDHDYLWCGSCGTLDDAPVPYPCETLEALAAIYAEHEDYQQEWAK